MVESAQYNHREIPYFDFSPPEGLEALTPTVVNTLYDILTKWGNEYTDELVRVYRFRYESERFAIQMSAPVNPDEEAFARFITFKHSRHLHGTHIIHTKSGERILWDKDLSVEDTVETIEEIDQLGKEHGMVDANGRRLPLPDHIRIKP